MGDCKQCGGHAWPGSDRGPLEDSIRPPVYGETGKSGAEGRMNLSRICFGRLIRSVLEIIVIGLFAGVLLYWMSNGS